jgi:hypothetical protein
MPCPRFTAFFSAASTLITVKIVVPTSGSLEAIEGFTVDNLMIQKYFFPPNWLEKI